MTQGKTVKNRQIKKRISIKEAKDILDKGAVPENSPRAIERRMCDEVNKKLKEEGREFSVEEGGAIQEYVIMKGLDNHVLLAGTVDKQYSPMVIKFAEDLVKEYKCKTPSEKALVHAIASAYYRILKCSRSYNLSMHPEWLSKEKGAFLESYSKELDRANRQFVNALQALKMIKQPPIKMNVKTNNAYLAQNQQINTVVEDDTTHNNSKDEIIE